MLTHNGSAKIVRHSNTIRQNHTMSQDNTSDIPSEPQEKFPASNRRARYFLFPPLVRIVWIRRVPSYKSKEHHTAFNYQLFISATSSVHNIFKPSQITNITTATERVASDNS